MAFVVAFSIFGAVFSTWITIANSFLHHWYLFWVPIILFVLFFGIALLLFLIITYICTINVDIEEDIDKPKPFAVWICQQFAQFLVLLSGIRIHTTGLDLIPKDTRFLYVSNHRSNLDPIIVMDRLRQYDIAFISKISNMKIPVIGKLIHLWCFMSIDRENARNAIKTIQKASNYIKNDIVSIGIYPEGTRSKSQQMGEFHAGSFKIAQKANCPLVIGAVRGTEVVKYRFWHISHCYIDILDVMDASEIKNMKSVELADKTKHTIAEFIRSTGEDPGC